MSLTSATKRRRGFSLVEMLVVIGILAILMGISLPFLMRAKKTANRARIASDLQAISVALEAYQQDFHDYPRTNFTPDTNYSYWGQAGDPGAYLLAAALVGPGPAIPLSGTEPTPTSPPSYYPPTLPPMITQTGSDGADGPGFRIRPGAIGVDNTWGTGDDIRPVGKVYGPYLQADKIKLVQINTGRWALADPSGHPYLYYPKRPGLTAPNTPTISQSRLVGLYFWNDNPTLPSTASSFTAAVCSDPFTFLRSALGDTNNDNAINGSETLAFSGPFLLWATGQDGIFGPGTMPGPISDSATMSTMVKDADDVFNFQP